MPILSHKSIANANARLLSDSLILKPAVDTLGLLLVVVTAASVQDRDGARWLC